MSVYSGFCTRTLENLYNNCLATLISILAERCIQALKQEKADDIRFGAQIGRLVGEMTKIEEHKYTTPKYTVQIEKLTQYLCVGKQSQETPSKIQKERPQSFSVKPKEKSTSNRLKTESSGYAMTRMLSLKQREMEFQGLFGKI